MKAFFDSTGGLWAAGSLVGKPATMLTSTASQGGGQETTIMTAVTQLTHHGMIFVPPGYTFGPSMFDLAALHGGSPWGAGTFAGPTGDRKPSDMELAYAKHQVRARHCSRRLSCCSCCRREAPPAGPSSAHRNPAPLDGARAHTKGEYFAGVVKKLAAKGV